ncbi:hypothetical protein RND81_08G165500 [Saponaria officinalis]|uniref:Caffeoyl-CoA O-methyltransferase n=1 Tax=Saponaria officinalis TaxID=3572 RepID=A0AAW1J7I3_SAPOF
MSHFCCVTRSTLSVTIPSLRYPDPQDLPLSSYRKDFSIKHDCYKSSYHVKCCSTYHGDVVVNDNNFINKQVVSLTPQLYDYVLSNTREPEILRELREETSTMRGSKMQVAPDQAQLLAMLVQILGASRCIEVGVYTGYSSLAVALALHESGRLVACERDEIALQVAKRYYERAGVLHKVDIRHGPAIDTLNSLLLNGEAGTYDFAFIDAEKKRYMEYFELLLKLVRVGGLIVIDNVLWYGKVADPSVNDSITISLKNFNKAILADERVCTSLVPIGDGMTICWKK